MSHLPIVNVVGIIFAPPLSIVMNGPIVVCTDPNVILGSVVNVVPGESAAPAVNVNAPPSDLQPAEGLQLLRNVIKAFEYLDQVKFELFYKPKIYTDFLDTLKAYDTKSIEAPEAVNRVTKLLHGYPNLMSGFATFLPPDYAFENDEMDNDSMETEFSGDCTNQDCVIHHEEPPRQEN